MIHVTIMTSPNLKLDAAVISGPPPIEESKTAEPARWKTRQEQPLLFTTSKWNAIAHISGNHVAIEASFPHPVGIFPIRVMRQVDYGIANAGLTCRVVQYESADGAGLGTILYLFSGTRTVGCYAMRHGAEISQTPQLTSSTHTDEKATLQ